ncbi:serine O-acetyltransferase [Gillisia sp. Q332]|uniref:serine O-acetyltransferase n=1 Tax=Gillisia xinjiangensis TaxID=3384765 RepID=UPI00391A0CAF
MTIKELLTEILGDLGNHKNFFRTFFYKYSFNPSFRLLLNYRIGKYFNSSKYKIFKLIAIRYSIVQLKKRNCQISYNTQIGRNVKFAHPLGIVIGSGVVIKDNVKIWQQVTFGSHGKADMDKLYPVIEKNVKIYSGAKIIGKVRIGENAIIGANAVVLIDVPDNSIAVGIPAKIINKS